VFVSETYEEVVFQARAKEIHATHYVHGDSDSPQYFLAVSDYKSHADEDEDEITVCDASDAYRTF
jgi:hypothetical protein